MTDTLLSLPAPDPLVKLEQPGLQYEGFQHPAHAVAWIDDKEQGIRG